uniref:Cytochrome P450 n=1 Tax=Panagrolaimus davidi TaxID=227884 RepID=A0A914PE79_9BILA
MFHGRPDDITYTNVTDLKYLDRFVKEVARFHPLAFTVTARRAIHSTNLKTSNGKLITIEKGVSILADSFTIQMDESIWGPDAKEFNPDRFLPENSENRHPMAWLPFGTGPRICPGKNLALHEAKAVLIFLLRKFKFQFCDETKTEIITNTITNFKELKMKVVPRL